MIRLHKEFVSLLVVLAIGAPFAAGQSERPSRRLSVDHMAVRMSSGESTRLALSALESEFVRDAKVRSASAATGDGFVLAPDTDGQIVLASSLLTPPGNHTVTISATSETGELRTATVDAVVSPLQAVPTGTTKPPVILLNGWQVGILNSCPVSSDVDTFGLLARGLIADGAPAVYYFDNCKESPNDLIENLGFKLGQVIDAIRYENGAQVPQVDLIGHSMGGLIIRSYLAGLGADGSLSPRLDTRVRKAIQIATPNFGSFYATTLLGAQTAEMVPGSSFLWSLATWNARGDDLRGVDALAIIGNGSDNAFFGGRPPNFSDGVVSITSASLGFARDATRTRILPYCHRDFGIGWQLLVDCLGSGIAKAPETSRIIRSFLANSTTWQTIGTTPPQDPWLSNFGGMFFAMADSNYQWISDLTSVSFGSESLSRNGGVFFSDRLSGTNTFRASSSSRGNLSCGPGPAPVGFFAALRCKSSPTIRSVGPLLSAVPGRVVQSGGPVTINGVGFGSRCSTCAVTAYPGIPLAISSWTDQAIAATLPSNFIGITRIVVRAAAGTDSITFMAAPPPSPPSLSISPSELQFTFTGGGLPPLSQTVAVANAGGGTLSWTASANVNWIRFRTTPNAVSVTVDPTGLNAGVYRGLLSFAAPGAASLTSPVTLTVIASSPPVVAVSSIVNAASGSEGAIAPGQIVTIKGTGLGPVSGVSFSVSQSTNTIATTLAGVRVLFGGVPAPITYASSGQINAIVPYEIAGRTIVPFQVEYQGGVSAGQNLLVAPAAPAAFTFNSTGTGTAVAANQDGSFNGPTNPAVKGSYLTIYFTGGGQTNPAGATGTVTGAVLKRLQQVTTVTVGGETATVLFAGAAPGLVDGVGQLNIQLSPNTPSGSVVPLVIRVGSAESSGTAFISVR
jgi:uncharacterized protein (TIGR03437 family)